MKKTLFGCLALVLMLVASCAGMWYWAFVPRVTVSYAEKRINTALPAGTPSMEVEQWLSAHSMPMAWLGEQQEKRILRSWVCDTGPRLVPFDIRDIMILFYFDGNGKLAHFTAQEEPRF